MRTLGVAIVAFNSADVIERCLESLFASENARVRVAVLDNASADETVSLVRALAGRLATTKNLTFDERPWDAAGEGCCGLSLLHAPFNGGYAFGVNAALRFLVRDPAIDLFWVLNPDCEVPPHTAAAYLDAGRDGAFSLMSGRTLYYDAPPTVQTDGGRVSKWTGVCRSVNAGKDPDTAVMPDPHSLDFLTGGNVVASRRFIESVGLMREDFFLYYEEVDWAMRRGDLPLRIAPRAEVRHHGGTAIGSGTAKRRASAFANYFNVRNRIRFLGTWRPWAVPFGIGHALAKAAQLFAMGARREAVAIIAGALGLPPPRAIRDRISPGPSRDLAFGKRPGSRKG